MENHQMPLAQPIRFGASILPQRFWKRVFPMESGCWEWDLPEKCGYGAMRFDGRWTLAHRIMALVCGMAIQGVCVCHHCDNPTCVNPEHLFIGSRLDNMLDIANTERRWRQRKTH